MLELVAMAGAGVLLGIGARLLIKGVGGAPWFVAILLGVVGCVGGAWLAGQVAPRRLLVLAGGLALGLVLELIYVPLANRGK